MPNSNLALFGGEKTINYEFERFNTFGKEEIEAANEVLKTGNLSQYIGAWCDDFYGGPKVRQFEKECQSFFRVKHAITVNSWTSGLISSIGAIGIEPGDEIITSPWTMCATATAILHWNAIPVFADIETRTFGLDPKSIEENISPHTKAILSVDIFGHSADIDSIMQIANKYNLKVISDSAQSPGALYRGKHAGTTTHVGGYSLNYHKHIHTGEGGIIVTDDDEIAERLSLIRNHAEAVVEQKKISNLSNMLGHNFRLGELECAIGLEQLKKLPNIINKRQNVAEKLSKGLNNLSGLRVPIVEDNCTHVYYVYPLLIDCELIKIPKEKIYLALKAEGVPGISASYQNIHLLPMYQYKIAYGSDGFPWSSEYCKREINYSKGICPNAEYLQDFSYIGLSMCLYELKDNDIDLVIKAFKKVWSNLNDLT